MVLKAFDSKPKCMKCFGNNISIEYCYGQIQDVGNCRHGKMVPAQECLHILCNNCGYQWSSECAKPEILSGNKEE